MCFIKNVFFLEHYSMPVYLYTISCYSNNQLKMYQIKYNIFTMHTIVFYKLCDRIKKLLIITK